MSFLSLLIKFCVRKYFSKALINTLFPLEQQTGALCICGAPVDVFLEKKASFQRTVIARGQAGLELSAVLIIGQHLSYSPLPARLVCPELAFSCSATIWLTAQHFGIQTDSQALKIMLRRTGKVCAQQYPQTGTRSSANRHSQKRSGTQAQRLGWHLQEELLVTSGSTQLLKKSVLNLCSH